jgi:SAM-dependent methyltransferase
MTSSQPTQPISTGSANEPPKRGLRARLFAWMMSDVNSSHDKEVAPVKRELLSMVHGDVLEIGPGGGANFAYFAPDIRWVGVEPNPYMDQYLRANAEGRSIELRTGYSEALPAADESMDAVVSTLVLCSVKDVNATLAEIRRVLKPGGKYFFLEHVAARAGSGLRRRQEWIQPLWGFAADGCHPERELWRNLEGAGFSQLEMKHFEVSVPIIKPHIAGFAIK